MATLRDIKSRITGVKNTQQITKAMKMVAAARLRRAQDNIINARPYSRKIAEVLNNLLLLEKNFSNPLAEERELKKAVVIVVTSDRGLCGGFNMNAIREAEQIINSEFAELKREGNLELICLGKKGLDHFGKRNYEVTGRYPGIFADLKYEFVSKLISELIKRFLNREIDQVKVVYNEFKSVVQQNIVAAQLLPIKPRAEKDLENASAEYIFEPDKPSIINSLFPRYLNAQMWSILLESYAAELGARMTAMDMATENAKELIRTLQITFNKERQASITSEILEIVSGANALKKG